MIMCFVSLAVTIFIVHLFTRANAVAPSPMPSTVSRCCWNIIYWLLYTLVYCYCLNNHHIMLPYKLRRHAGSHLDVKSRRILHLSNDCMGQFLQWQYHDDSVIKLFSLPLLGYYY